MNDVQEAGTHGLLRIWHDQRVPTDMQIPAPSTFTMWEALAARGRADDLAVWVDAHASRVARIYRSPDERVVVIGPAPLGLPAPPVDLVLREPQGWDFAEVDRS